MRVVIDDALSFLQNVREINKAIDSHFDVAVITILISKDSLIFSACNAHNGKYVNHTFNDKYFHIDVDSIVASVFEVNFKDFAESCKIVSEKLDISNKCSMEFNNQRMKVSISVNYFDGTRIKVTCRATENVEKGEALLKDLEAFKDCGDQKKDLDKTMEIDDLIKAAEASGMDKSIIKNMKERKKNYESVVVINLD